MRTIMVGSAEWRPPLANGAKAWRAAFEPLTPAERAMFVRTLEAYERLAGSAD